ncbi:hypothetical protein IKQ65_03640 [Candidatus Saccharibacteria bacterium]|nr:hypothetical protein [Candidatus Saccharibacteria bacterium]
MGNASKLGDSITLYFGDKMREHLPKALRKQNIYFVDCTIVGTENGTLSVLSQTKNPKDKPPYKILALCIKEDDRHILPENTLELLRDIDKEYVVSFATEHGYSVKEFKEALKPYRKGYKND